MGDYMRLDYNISLNTRPSVAGDGFLVVKLDEKKVGTFSRFYASGPLAAQEKETPSAALLAA